MRTVLVALVVGVAVSMLAYMATTVYLHRALAHRALALRPVAAHGFRFVIWVTTGIRPRQWVAVHRKHHAFTDVEGDPHSPVLNGWVKVQLMNVAMYRREAHNPRTVAALRPGRCPRLGSTGCSTTTPWSVSVSASSCCARSSDGRSVSWPRSSTSTSTSPARRR